MNDYFEGASNQLIKRGKLLLEKIPRNLPREFHLLEQRCRDRLHMVFEALKKSSETEIASVRLRSLRRAVHELDYLETVGIAALNRADLEEDVWLNGLIMSITREIQYPLLPPVVTSLSHSYFHIYTDLNLVRVPLVEGSFLLHLPDLYHELTHPLLTYPDDPRIEPIQAELIRVLDYVLLHNMRELERFERKGVHDEYKYYVRLWDKCWWKYWAVEFFCDLFSVYTVGPAFAWSHYHLTAKRGANPFEVPTIQLSSHPADAIRMEAMLKALTKIGFPEEAQLIRSRWNELVKTSGFAPAPIYYSCYRDHVIDFVVDHSLIGTKAIGCRIAAHSSTAPIYNLLNEAWIRFWKAPHNYSGWEKERIDSLRRQKRGLPELLVPSTD